MRDELTQRERDDMRDLLVAGAQRIRPFNWDAVVASVAVTVVLVAGAGVAIVLSGSGALNRGVVGAPTSSPTITPGPSPTKPPAWCKGGAWSFPSLPEATLPAPGEHLTLEPDPCLTAYRLLGSYEWVVDQGADGDLLQGFQRAAGIQPWFAPLADGSGSCIVIRAEDLNGFSEIACDAPGEPATVERVVGDSTVRFVVENDAIAVYVE